MVIEMNDLKFTISKLFSSFFYVGFSGLCPGTFGSIATLPLWVGLNYILSLLKLDAKIYLVIIVCFILLLYFLGELSTRIYMQCTNKEDPTEVVIDEVVGQLISFFLSSILIFLQANKVIKIINNDCKCMQMALISLLLITPFIFFRLFDITKPSIIGYIDKNWNNSKGVMLDDVFAGIFAGMVNASLIYIFLYFLNI